MKSLIALLITAFILNNCAGFKKGTSYSFSLRTPKNNKKVTLGKSLRFKVIKKQHFIPDSIHYFIDNRKIGTGYDLKTFQYRIKKEKAGKHTASVRIYYNGKSELLRRTIHLFYNKKPLRYTYSILNEYPHNDSSFTQGLEFYKDTLYESIGQYGKSSLLKTDFKTGRILNKIELDSGCFGEGITIIDNKLYQLTWKQNKGFVYDINSFKPLREFGSGDSKENWGLCNDGATIYKSDGTHNIWKIKPETLQVYDSIEVYTNREAVKNINEMEFVNGKIYANIFLSDRIIMIDPETGYVKGIAELKGLIKKVKKHPKLNVLNGIAFNKKNGKLFVTGKNWSKLFEIILIKK